MHLFRFLPKCLLLRELFPDLQIRSSLIFSAHFPLYFLMPLIPKHRIYIFAYLLPQTVRSMRRETLPVLFMLLAQDALVSAVSR